MSEEELAQAAKAATDPQYGWATTYEVPLPSGATVIVRPANLASLVKAGRLPKELASVAMETASGMVRGKPVDLEKLGAFFESIIKAILVQPDPATLDFAGIPEGDVLALYQWVMGNHRGKALAWAPFRPE